jgi:hypothetical protein
MLTPIRTYIHRSHAVAIFRMPSGAYAFQIDDQEIGRARCTTALAASVAADTAVDTLVEDGPAAVDPAQAPLTWGDA